MAYDCALATQQIPFRLTHGCDVRVQKLRFLPAGERSLALDHVYLGPTAHDNIAMNSLKLFLDKHRASPARGISYCQIPYRQH